MSEDSWVRWVMQTARTWDDLSFLVQRTGVEAIDSDHRRLTEYGLEINRFIDAVEQAQVDLSYIGQQGQLLEELYQYARAHFAREEALIAKYGLEGMATQRQQHQRILDMLSGTVRDYQAGRLTITANLKLAILEWVVVHINHVDYECFKLDRWREVLQGARAWEDVTDIVQRTLVDPLDDEHRRLTELFLHLGQALRQTEGASPADNPVLALLDQLGVAAQEHFAHEEAFQSRFGLPDLETHQVQHREFMAQLAEYGERLRQGSPALLGEVEMALLEWWISHISEVDYAMYGMARWGHLILERAACWDDIGWVVRRTGVEDVDTDHRRLVEVTLELNSLLARAEEDRAHPVADALALFEQLHRTAAEHFAREEGIMRGWHQPGFAEHCAEHRRLLGVVETFREHLAANRLTLTTALKVKMMEWWANHTNGTDWVAFHAHTEQAASTEESVR